MNRTRDNNRGKAYEEYLADVAKEQAEERRLEAQRPENLFAATANAEAEQNQDIVLHERLSDEYLSDFGTIVRQPFHESQVEATMAEFTETSDYVRSRGNAEVLVEFLYRNNLSPAVCESYHLAHSILKLWNGYPDEVTPAVQSEVATESSSRIKQWKPSEQFKVDQANRDTVIGVVDGVKITEKYLDSLPSRDELKIRRKLEKGHSGNQLYDTYLEIRDLQFARDAEIAAKAAAAERGE